MSSYSYLIVRGQQVRETTGVSQNLEDEKIKPRIKVAQQAAENVLGRTLYALIEAAHIANPATMGGAGMLLLYTDYIVPAVAWRTMAISSSAMYAAPDRNGTFVRNGNDYSSVDHKTLAMVKTDNESVADNYQQRLIDYVKELDSTDPIRVAYETNVKCEERIKETQKGNIILRESRYQRTHNQ